MSALPIASRFLADHRIHAIIPFDPSPQDGPSLVVKLDELVQPSPSPNSGQIRPATDWLPPSAREALQGRYRDTEVWQPQRGQAHAALHPHVCALIEATDDRVKRFVLSNEARKLVREAPQASPEAIARHGGPNLPRYRLLLLLPRSAESRFARAIGSEPESADPKRPRQAVWLEIHGVTLHRFATGLALADAEIEVHHIDGDRKIELGLLNEVTAALSHVHKLAWQPMQGPDVGTILPGRFDLTDIVSSLVEGVRASRRSVHRTYMFTTAILSDAAGTKCDPEALLLAASRLARSYTEDYAISGPPPRTHSVTEFDNIAMVAAREGASIVVDLSKRPDGLPAAKFLYEFRTQAVAQAYGPLTILALHERAEIVRTAAEASQWVEFGGTNPSQAEQLERVSQRALRLRLAYRFSEVGRITQHNAWHRAMREALALDPMTDEMRDDVTAIHEQLWQHLDRAAASRALNRERRFKPIAAMVAALVAGNAIFGPAKEAIETALGWKAGAVYTALGLMVVVALLAGFWTMRIGSGRGDGKGA